MPRRQWVFCNVDVVIFQYCAVGRAAVNLQKKFFDEKMYFDRFGAWNDGACGSGR